ncbi:MAG TPA: threo-3-hydroxy-L-aspartate ammonia-lyase [Candidatus Acidoferrales bacterium]|nr:threo-3-hydroxy-L-aspartate ammonia-lyase [Candidatus Acidoferrales bacterium]
MGAFAVAYVDVAAAARRLEGVAHRTPVVTSRSLDRAADAAVFLKCENLQRVGAFKFRGAYNRIASLDAAARTRGVVAFSSGNHAQGVALAAALLGSPAAIVMPSDAPRGKLDATRGYGAEVVLYDRMREDRAALARRLADERGAALVPPYDDPAIVAGQGTVGDEFLSEIPDLDVLLVPLGGGGLLAGCSLAAIERRPDIEIYGVEPEAGDDWRQSLARGERVTIAVPQTIADGAQTTSPGVLTFPIVQKLARGAVTVSDDELRAAMRFAFERLKLVVEPTGALALAAVLQAKVATRGRRVGAILSGGNVDPATFADTL